jgi:signal transduction histidine kinase
VGVVGALLAAETVMVVRTEPEVTWAGTSGGLLVLEVVAGLSLVAGGAVAVGRAATRACGLLAALAGALWLSREWDSPSAGSAVVFTLGLALAGTAPAVLANAAFRFPGVPGSARVLVPLGYAVAGWQAVAPALFLDPATAGCTQCPANVILVADRAGWSEVLQRSGTWAASGWAGACAAGLLWAGWKVSPARRRDATPFAAAVALSLAVTAWGDARAALSWTPQTLVDDRLWVLEAAALTLCGAALLHERVHAHRVRVALARLAVDLAEHGSGAELVPRLSRLVGDSSLTVVYPRPDNTLIGSDGKAAELPAWAQSTVLSRGGQPIAYLVHRVGALDDDAVAEEIRAVAAMSVDHERHLALARAHIDELRASRSRIVAARDAERRRLERALHDGAQQRLVTLALLLRLAQRDASVADARLLVQGAAEVTSALGALRDIAHGIYPAALADEGVEAALQGLSETAPLTIEAGGIAGRRYPPAVESAAYFTLAQLVRLGIHDQGRITATQTDHGLRFAVDVDTIADEMLDGLEDRIGALDGRLSTVPRGSSRSTVVVELPCA